MPHIHKNHVITTLDEADILKRMRLDRTYYHCIRCGEIYEDKKMTIKIIDLMKLNGSPYLPRILQKLFNSGAKGKGKISSTLCNYCFDRRRG